MGFSYCCFVVFAVSLWYIFHVSFGCFGRVKVVPLEGIWCCFITSFDLYTNSECVPVCRQGCVNGNCIDPDVCRCWFGWVGANCSTSCECHGKGNCLDERHLNNCTDCLNNTKVNLFCLVCLFSICLLGTLLGYQIFRYFIRFISGLMRKVKFERLG